jgi:hypothetical protein
MSQQLVIATIFMIVIFGISSAYGADMCQFDYDCNKGRCVGFISKDYPNGINICDCDNSYVDFDGVFCIYKQKKQITAFLFAFFLGVFGVNWFYVGDGDPVYNAIGVIKCFFCIMFIISFWCTGYCAKKISQKGIFCANFMATVSILTLCVTIVWHMADWIWIAADPCNMKDPNDICLASW